MKLYHASPLRILHPDISYSREALDFGKGFYLTILKDQAIKYSKRFTNRGKDAYLNIYELDDTALEKVRVKNFSAYDEEWLDFVTRCRSLQPVERYDIVTGGIADDNVFNTIDLYYDGLISKTEALDRLKYEKPNHQLCILTQQIIDESLKFIDCQKL